MEWSIERLILVTVYAACVPAFALLLVFGHRRQAVAAFLFQQMLTWLLGLVVVQARWLEYPVRELSEATRTSFLFEFLAFPVLASFFNAWYPKDRKLRRIAAYYVGFTAFVTVPEYFIERHTALLDYSGWDWYWTFVSVWVCLYASRCFVRWYLPEGNRTGLARKRKVSYNKSETKPSPVEGES